jgi:hypothetical protein
MIEQKRSRAMNYLEVDDVGALRGVCGEGEARE